MNGSGQHFEATYPTQQTPPYLLGLYPEIWASCASVSYLSETFEQADHRLVEERCRCGRKAPRSAHNQVVMDLNTGSNERLKIYDHLLISTHSRDMKGVASGWAEVKRVVCRKSVQSTPVAASLREFRSQFHTVLSLLHY